MFSKVAKLVLLFFSPDNPLWKDLVDSLPITQQKIAAVAGISQSTLGNWKKGGPINLPHLQEALAALIKKVKDKNIEVETRADNLIARIETFQLQCSDSNLSASVYEVAEQTLSLSMDECQQILDEIIYDSFTLYPSLSYDTRIAADQDFNTYGGLYHVYVRRRHSRWLKCPLRVRYVVKAGTRYAIRCKLNAPVLRREPNAPRRFEYDGFLKPITKKKRLAWKFEKRDALDADFFDVITNEGDLYGDEESAVRILSGAYLTTGQDALYNIEHSDVIMKQLLLEQLVSQDYSTMTKAEIAKIIADWMHQTSCVLDENSEEWHDVNALWNAYGKQDARANVV
jgi:hypothetical protein